MQKTKYRTDAKIYIKNLIKTPAEASYFGEAYAAYHTIKFYTNSIYLNLLDK